MMVVLKVIGAVLLGALGLLLLAFCALLLYSFFADRVRHKRAREWQRAEAVRLANETPEERARREKFMQKVIEEYEERIRIENLLNPDGIQDKKSWHEQ